jgi:hypothetical protein
MLSRIPAKYVKTCGMYLTMRSVRKCMKKCFYPKKK